ncbi:MAG: enoyl-CoA hydratase-related protein [Pseudomonadota bacterium]|nr:enoyl-CoA hydratase-related protein [Pseudomonadota bacterium]
MTDQQCTLQWLNTDTAVITLERREKRNALNAYCLNLLLSHLHTIQNTKPRPKCFILTGTGPVFCAGADLSDIQGLSGTGVCELGDILDSHFTPVLSALHKINIPCITALNGPAVGIGVMLALSGDIILTTEDSYMRLNFSRLGLIPDGGLTYWLPQLVGRHRTIQMILMDEPLTATQAKEIGIVYDIVHQSDLMNKAQEIAKNVSKGSVCAHREALKLVRESMISSYDEQLQAEARAQTVCGKSIEFKEALKNFLFKKNK